MATSISPRTRPGVPALYHALAAAFCLFFAGEEMSWGQRLLGLTPPAYFLERNTQQEMNVHNFGDIFGRPKGPLAILLSGCGLILPLVARAELGRRLLARLGATPPLSATIPRFSSRAEFQLRHSALRRGGRCRCGCVGNLVIQTHS